MTSAIQQLGAVSRLYDRLTQEYEQIATEAAIAEADYRRVKSIRLLEATATGSSVAKAEHIANADENVADACMRYKTTAALAEARRARLTQLREQVAVGRSVLVNDREADKLHSQGVGGHA